MYEDRTRTEERMFSDLRRKVRNGELLSTDTKKLLRNLRFTGRLCIVIQNGDVMKSGYEEGYFSRRQETGWSLEARLAGVGRASVFALISFLAATPPTRSQKPNNPSRSS